MKLSQFRFDLPLNLIAQNPTKKREESRLMVIHRKTGQIEKVAWVVPAMNPSHCTFSTVPQNSGAVPEGYPSVDPENPLKLQEIQVKSQAIAEAVPLQEVGNCA